MEQTEHLPTPGALAGKAEPPFFANVLGVILLPANVAVLVLSAISLSWAIEAWRAGDRETFFTAMQMAGEVAGSLAMLLLAGTIVWAALCRGLGAWFKIAVLVPIAMALLITIGTVCCDYFDPFQ